MLINMAKAKKANALQDRSKLEISSPVCCATIISTVKLSRVINK